MTESALILACVRAHYNSKDLVDVTRRASDGVAWSKVLSIARRHGIAPLVYESLARGLQLWPEDALTELRRDFRQSAANSFLYAAELVRLSNHLQQRSIAALAFKGPTLALLLYGQLSLRTIRDLDLLVAEDQIDPALSALQQCGYEPVSGLGGARPSVSGRIRKHILLVHHARRFAVELHWAIAESSFAFPLRFQDVWTERHTVMVMEQPVATLSREHMFLMMCAHGTNHCWGSLKWICDIAQAVSRSPDLDWHQLLARARALGCHRMLSVGLALARDICGVQLPAELESCAGTEKVHKICADIQERLFADREPVAYLERTLTFVRSRERFLDRIRILLCFIVPELKPKAGDLALIRLPNVLRILSFPLRLVRIFLFRWKRTVRPIAKSALDWRQPGSLAANRPD